MENYPNTKDLIEQGIEARNNKDYSQALDLLDQAEAYPELLSQAYFEQAVTYAELRNYTSAKKLLYSLLEMDPKAISPQSFLADLLIDEGEYDEAERLIRKAIHDEPKFTYSFSQMVRLFEAKEDYEAEYTFFREVLPFYDDDLELLYNFSFFVITYPNYRDQKHLTEALQYLKQVQDAGLDDNSLDYHIGKTYFLLGDNEKCVEYLERYLDDRRKSNPNAGMYGITFFIEDHELNYFTDKVPQLSKHGDLIDMEPFHQSKYKLRDMVRGIVLGH